MTEGEKIFFSLLAMTNLNRVKCLFDKRKLEYRGDDIANFGTMSSGEKVMTYFYLNIWLHRDYDIYHFDLFQAVGILDSTNLNVVKKYINNPFFA